MKKKLPLHIKHQLFNSLFPILTKQLSKYYLTISKLFNTERREVVFCTLWFIGQ